MNSNDDFSMIAETAKRSGSIQGPQVSKKMITFNPIVCGLVFIVAVSIGSFIFTAKVQQKMLENQEKLERLDLKITKLSNQITEADANFHLTDANFGEQFKKVNSEIRKLWDLSNKKNRGTINEQKNRVDVLISKADASQKKIEKVEEQLSTINKYQVTLKGELEKSNTYVQDSLGKLQKNISGAYTLKDIKSIEARIKSLESNLHVSQSKINTKLIQIENTIRDLSFD